MAETFDIYEELALAIRALEDAGVDYAVCGGLAVAFHGFVRNTDDIDLVVRAEHIDKAMEALESAGFILKAGAIPLPSQGITFYRTSKAVGEDLLPVDMLPLPKDHEWLRNRKRIQWDEGELWVLSKPDLIAMKSTSKRAKDRIDIDELGRRQAG